MLILQATRSRTEQVSSSCNALNRFYNGSVALVKESSDMRVLLVGITLVECKLDTFQRIGLLLSHHRDLLCRIIQNDMNLEVPDASQSLQEEVESIESATKDAYFGIEQRLTRIA
jgi:hypothetical protein